MKILADKMDKDELKTVFTTELFNKIHQMIEKKKIDLENAILLLKHIGYYKVLKGISLDGFGISLLNRRFEKMIFEEDQKKEGENEKLLSDLCECYMSLSFFFQTEMLRICVPCVLKVALKKEEEEEAQKDAEMALLTFRNIDIYYVVIEELYMKEMMEIMKYHQKHRNLTRHAYQSAWEFLMGRLYNNKSFEEVFVNELHFAREASRELEQLIQRVDWKRAEEERGKEGKETKEEWTLMRWLNVISPYILECKLWNEELVELIGSIVNVYRTAKNNFQVKIEDLLKSGAVDVFLEVIVQFDVKKKLVIDYTIDTMQIKLGNLNSWRADLGDIESFVEHKKLGAGPNEYVFFFDTGDLSQGTGLSDASPIQGEFVFETIKRMSYDGLSIGNHELSSESCIDHIVDDFAPFFNGKYLGWNVKHVDVNRKITDKYRFIELPNNQGKILVAGFVYNMPSSAKNVIVTKIESILTDEEWEEIANEKDIVLMVMLCHIATDADELTNLDEFLSGKFKDIPKVYLTGHSHMKRDRAMKDGMLAVESGCYGENLGIVEVSIPKKPAAEEGKDDSFAEANEVSMAHRWVDWDEEQLRSELGMKGSFLTEKGYQIKQAMKAKAEEYELFGVLGCSEMALTDNAEPKEGERSIYDFMIGDVLPTITNFRQKQDRHEGTTPKNFFFIGMYTLRAPIYKDVFITDDVFCIDPFNNTWSVIPDVPGSLLIELINAVNPPELRESNTSSSSSSSFSLSSSSSSSLISSSSSYSYSSKYNSFYSPQFEHRHHGTVKRNFVTSNEKVDAEAVYDIVASSYDTNKLLKALEDLTADKYKAKDTNVQVRPLLKSYVGLHWQCPVDKLDGQRTLVLMIAPVVSVLVIAVIALVSQLCGMKRKIM
eukprot:MONOS_9651.1-p1 / transcript=MONOS_9651.1 / gene=MONOS_9651 / organism=Monocercomonoides_exilis_PA203 / gene_product=5' nucleotidase family protein / transcript_product=5' nucleotidase family protein / location=Mono_scaffold00406:16251-20821(+) / protein_length=884 / sequence_SO=supercontig / SO=protein_coding / is_pseudo=false